MQEETQLLCAKKLPPPAWLPAPPPARPPGSDQATLASNWDEKPPSEDLACRPGRVGSPSKQISREPFRSESSDRRSNGTGRGTIHGAEEDKKRSSGCCNDCVTGTVVPDRRSSSPPQITSAPPEWEVVPPTGQLPPRPVRGSAQPAPPPPTRLPCSSDSKASCRPPAALPNDGSASATPTVGQPLYSCLGAVGGASWNVARRESVEERGGRGPGCAGDAAVEAHHCPCAKMYRA